MSAADETDSAWCPTCGPTLLVQHHRRTDVLRCANCAEWLHVRTDASEAD